MTGQYTEVTVCQTSPQGSKTVAYNNADLFKQIRSHWMLHPLRCTGARTSKLIQELASEMFYLFIYTTAFFFSKCLLYLIQPAAFKLGVAVYLVRVHLYNK